MDDLVLRGMAKWPNVPAVYGWLSLDRRGQWLIKGERISNPIVTAFIGRNYERDERGCWFFQNGPQRVFVASRLHAPRLRVVGAERRALALEAHTGQAGGRGRGRVARRGRLARCSPPSSGRVSCTITTCRSWKPRSSTSNGSPLAEDVLEELMELAAQGERGARSGSSSANAT